MSQKITQQRVCYLETYGEENILELISTGLFLSDLVERIDPDGKVGISTSILSRWLSGKLKRNIRCSFDLPGIEGITEEREPETAEQAAERGKRYKEARTNWSEAIVEKQAKRLFEEDGDKMANLRKAQAEFALKIAAVHDKRYAEQKGANVAVQVNVGSGEYHLNALRKRVVQSRISEPETKELE